MSTPKEPRGSTEQAKESQALSSESIEQAYRQYQNQLVRYLVSRLGDRSEHAADIAQECFFRLSRYKGSLLSMAELRSLLYQIARNMLIDFYRHGKVIHSGEHVDIDDHEPASSAPTQERIVSGQEQLETLESILLTLPPRCQEVFVLSRFEELKYDEIAERCGISVSMVEKHIAKAMKIIRQRMRG